MPEFDKNGIPIRKTSVTVETDKNGIPIKKKAGTEVSTLEPQISSTEEDNGVIVAGGGIGLGNVLDPTKIQQKPAVMPQPVTPVATPLGDLQVTPFTRELNPADKFGRKVVRTAPDRVVSVDPRTVPIRAPFSEEANEELYVNAIQDRIAKGTATKIDQEFITKNERPLSQFNELDDDSLMSLTGQPPGVTDAEKYAQVKSLRQRLENEIREAELNNAEVVGGNTTSQKIIAENKQKLEEVNLLETKLSRKLTNIATVGTGALVRTDESGNDASSVVEFIKDNWNFAETLFGDKKNTFDDRVKALPPEFVTGLNYLKYKDPVEAERVARALAKGEPISESQVATIRHYGLDIEKDRLDAKLDAGEVTQEDYDAGKQAIGEKSYENLVGNKETLRSFMSSQIAEHLDAISNPEGDRGVMSKLFGNRWNYTDQDIASAAQVVARANGIDANDARVQEVVKYLQDNEGAMILSNSISKAGWTRNLGKGLAQPLRGIASTVSALGQTDAEEYAAAQSQGNVNIAQKNVARVENSWEGRVGEVVEGFGQLVSQVGLGYLGGGVVGGLGKAAIGTVGAEALAAGIPAAEIGTGVRIGQNILKSKDFYSTFLSTYASTYGDNKKTALGYTADDGKAVLTANALTGLESLAETILSPIGLAKGVARNFLKPRELAKGFVKIIDDVAVAQRPAAFRKLIYETVKAPTEIVGSEVFEEVLTNLGDYGANMMLNPQSQSFQSRELTQELMTTAGQTGLTMVIPALIGGVSAANANNFSKGSLLIAAQNTQHFIDDMKVRLHNGEITQEDYNARVTLINTAATANAKLPVKANGQKLSSQEKADYIYSRSSEAVLSKQLEDNTDEAEKSVINQKIVDQQEFRKNILNNENNQVPEGQVPETTEGQALQTEGEPGAATAQVAAIVEPSQEGIYVMNGITYTADKNGELVDEKGAMVPVELRDSVKQYGRFTAKVTTAEPGTQAPAAAEATVTSVAPVTAETAPAVDGVTVSEAVITVDGLPYYGKNHAEALMKAKADGKDISQVDRAAQGRFLLSNGKTVSRAEAKDMFGKDRAEMLIPQDDAAAQANKDYAAEVTIVKTKQDAEAAKQREKEAKERWKGVEKQIDTVQPVLDKVAKNESLNENELKAAEDALYDIIDKNPDAASLLEPEIIKIQNHENVTKTETRTVTEKVPIEGTVAARSKKETRPALEQVQGKQVTVTLPDGDVRKGTLAVKGGNYVVDVASGAQVVIGEKAINDRDLTLPDQDRVENPIELDEDRNVKAITLQTRNGNFIKIEDPDVALGLSIQVQADALGDSDAAFDQAYEEVQREIQVEVPVPVVKKAAVVTPQVTATKVTTPQATATKVEPTTEPAPAAEQKPAEEKKPPLPRKATTKEEAIARLKQARAKAQNAPAPAAQTQAQGETIVVDNTTVEGLEAKEGDSDLKKKMIGEAKKVMSSLKAIAPNLKVSIYDTDKQFKDATGDTGRGGFDPNTNTIHINLQAMERSMKVSGKNKSNTLLHEGVHPILNIIAPTGSTQMSDLFDQLSELSNVPGVRAVLSYGKSQKDHYEANGNEQQKKDAAAIGKTEAVVEFISQVANGDIDVSIIKNSTVLNKIAELLRNFANMVGIKVSPKNAGDIVKLAKQISGAFESGAVIAEMTVTGDEKPYVKFDLQKQGERDDFKRTKNFDKVQQKPLSYFKDKVITITGADRLATGDLIMPDGSSVNLKGGWAYPSETGKVWATASMGKANAIINKLNAAIKADGVAHLGIRAMTEQSAISNYSTFIAAANYLQSAMVNKDITKKELLERISKAYSNKSMGGKVSSIKSSIKADQVVNEILKDFSVSNSTFDQRKWFLQSVLGGVDIKSKSIWGGLPTSGELLKKVSDPILDVVRAQSLISVVRIDQPLTARETTAAQDGEIYHDAYPVVIESTATPETFLLDGAYNIEDVVPKFIDASTGEEITKKSYEEAGKPIQAGATSYVNKLTGGAAQVVRNIIPNVEAKAAIQFQKEVAEFEVGYAPFREGNVKTMDDAEKAFNNKKYKQWIAMGKRFASDLGLTLSEPSQTLGIYGATSQDMEASALVNVKGSQEDVETFAALMGTLAPDGQHSVMLNKYEEDGEDVEHKLTFKTRDAAEDFLQNKETYGVSDISFDPKTNTATVLEIKRYNSTFDEENFILKYGKDIEDYETAGVTNTFIEETSYGEIIQRGRDKGKGHNQGEIGENLSVVYELAGKRLSRQSGNRATLPESKKEALTKTVYDYVDKHGEEFGLSQPTGIGEPLVFSEELSTQIYNAYNNLQSDNSSDPQVKKAYSQLVKEVDAQYKFMTEDLGIQVDFMENDPYDDSVHMMSDVYDNNHLKVFQGGDPHPFLDEKDSNGLSANEKFRAVHDYFGHAVEGNPFGKRGEDAAWNAHSKMFSPLAQRAMSTETRGQNSWVNNSPVNKPALKKFAQGNDLVKSGEVAAGNKLIKEAQSEFQFAEQKVDLLPEELTQPMQMQGEVGRTVDEVWEEQQVADKELEDAMRVIRKNGPTSINDQLEAGNQKIIDLYEKAKRLSEEKMALIKEERVKGAKKPVKTTPKVAADIQRIQDDIQATESKIEDLENEIQIEKDNLKEEVARIRAEIAKVRASKMSKDQKEERIEDLKYEIEDVQDTAESTIESYKDDIADEKADLKRYNRDLKKAELPPTKMIQAQGDPTQDFGITNEDYDDALDNIIGDMENGVEDVEAITNAINNLRVRYGDNFDQDAFVDHIVNVIDGNEASYVSGITHERTAEMRKRMNLSDMVKTPITDEEIEAYANAQIAKGYDYNNLLRWLEAGNHANAIEVVLLGKYLNSAQAAVEANPTDANVAKAYRAIQAVEIDGSDVARAFRLRARLFIEDDSLMGYFKQEMEANGVTKLSDKHKEDVAAERKALLAAKTEYNNQLKKDKEKHNAKKGKETVANAGKKKSAKPKQSFDNERKSIITHMQETLQKLRATVTPAAPTNLQMQGSNPLEQELTAIHEDAMKMVRSFVEEGINEFDDVVDNLHAVLEANIPGVTRQDVIDLVAHEYAEKRPPRSALVERLQTLRTHAELLNKLRDLEDGKEPKTEKKTLQKNQEIKKLEDQIKATPLARDLATRAATERQIKQIEEDLANGNFLKTPKKPEPITLSQKTQEAKDKLIKLKREREVRLIKAKHEARNKYLRWGDNIAELFNVPRAVISSVDLSAPLRQAVTATVAHPILAFRAGVQMIKAARKQESYDRWFFDLQESPDYQFMIDNGLFIADPHDPRLAAREEIFMSNLAEKIPGIGTHLIKGSERAYGMYLNKMRVDLFRQGVAAFLSDTKPYKDHERLYKTWAAYVNNATGKGQFGQETKVGEFMKKATPILNGLFFSPGLIISRLNHFNPYYWKKMAGPVRKAAALDLVKFVGLGVSILMLAKYGFGGEDDDEVMVELDPRSTDFGKIRLGDTRYDMWGGFQQYIRVISQIITGEAKSASTGNIRQLDGKGVFGETRFGTLAKFARGKLAPIPSSIMNLGYHHDVVGNEVTLGSEGLKLISPLMVADLIEAYREEGLKHAVATGLPALFGVGVTTYSTKVEDVEDIEGVGAATEDRLEAAGVKDLDDILKKSRKELSKMKYTNDKGKDKKILGKKQLDAIDKIKREMRQKEEAKSN